MADRSLQVKIGANISGLKKGVNEAKGVLTDLTKSVNNMTAAFASIASIGVLAAPLAAAKQWAAAVNDLEDKTNMAAESASRLLAIGQRVGLSADEMGAAVMRMSKAAQTSHEKFGESSDVFSKWGIAIRDSNGNLLDAETILGNVATKHAQMANGVQKNAMEMEIFGKAGGKLNDLLNFSKEELAAFGKQAEKVGLVLSHDVTQAFENAQFKINDAKNALQGIGVSIGAEMLPEFKALADFCNDLATSFATSTKEQKRFIAIGLESAGVAGSMAIAIQAISAAYGFMVGAANKAKAAILAVNAAMAANPATLAAMGLAAAGYAAYNGYNKSTAKNSKGEALYRPEYDDNGVVSWVRTDAAEDTATAPTTTANNDTQTGVVGSYNAFVENEKAKTKALKAEKEERLKTETEYEALERETKTAMREADWQQFSEYLESEKAAKLKALEDEREIRQQFIDWKMEANESELAFGIQAAEQLKESLASGLADCIVNGENLADTLKNVGKAIVQMFLQWTINKRLAAVLDMTLGQQTAKANAAAAMGEATALSAAAIQKSIAECGPILGPAAYGTAMGIMQGTASSSISAAGAISLFPMASGGIVTAPTYALIGEGRDNEAVIPLNADSFQAIADGISAAGGGMTNTLIINGDVNNAGDLDSIMADFGDAVFAGLRGA